jgi:hypothetical protein
MTSDRLAIKEQHCQKQQECSSALQITNIIDIPFFLFFNNFTSNHGKKKYFPGI